MEQDQVIKILFFGAIAEKMGCRDVVLAVDADMSVADVVNAVGCDGYKPLLIAVNQRQIHDMNAPVKADDEVAMMPPFSGG